MVILILKHATCLRLLGLSPASALTHAELDYQEANIDSKIQEHLAVSAQEHTVEQFSDFIMATDIGLFTLTSVKLLSHQVCIECKHQDVAVPLHQVCTKFKHQGAIVPPHQVCPESKHWDVVVLPQPLVETDVHRKDHWFKRVWEPLRKATRKHK